jgi:2-polyprenyl-3-methyl-5-hydroxy-6-metoxy-1,4-benzoquinol methylase
MESDLQGRAVFFRMRCPACGWVHGAPPIIRSPGGGATLPCPECGYTLTLNAQGWDACVDQSYPREFSRQWVSWEAGGLGAPDRVYGTHPADAFADLLQGIGLPRDQLASMKILEVGYGHGTLLQEIQKWCPAALGIDLVKPLPSATLRPGSTIFGNLLHNPLVPGQFDLVVCKGVIHHTPDARHAFACLAEQLAPQGMLFLTIYEPAIKKTLQLRRVFPGSWRYPECLRLGIASLLGIPRAFVEMLRTRQFDGAAFECYHGNAKLGIFDVLTPRWTSLHTKEEVAGWFAAHGLGVRRLGPGHYVGKRL